MSHRSERVGDEAARRLAQTEFDHPVAVEAGAGTGKTTVLVARILAWCLGVGWPRARQRILDNNTAQPSNEEIAAEVLDGLVAITFTEAAAAQMARRVAEALAALAADPEGEIVGFYPDLLPNSDAPVLQTRARALTGSLDHLAVRTIHSHCFNLLATYSMAANLSPDLQVDADGHQLDRIVREHVERATKEAYAGSADHPLHRLAVRGVDPRMVATAVIELVADGSQAAALEGDPLSAQRRDGIRQQLVAQTAAMLQHTAPVANQTRAKKELELAEAIELTHAVSLESPEQPDLKSLARLLDRIREIWGDDRLARLAKWAQGEFTQTVTRLVAEDCSELSQKAGDLARTIRLYRRLDVEILDAGRRALLPLIAKVEEELRTQGIVTYSSLMTEAWQLLKDHPAVLHRERRRLDQLLVDEFQDTDRLQCDLVRFLALGGEEADRPGLFVVGDPKQSIYGWRNADLEAYEDFLEDLEAARGVCVALNRNFRSVPAILAEVDQIIDPVMKAEAGLQPAFASLLPADALENDPGFQQADRCPIEYWVSWADDAAKTSADQAARLEADAIARDIRDLHDHQDVAWNEFGLLLRSTSRLEIFLTAFRKVGVPFVVTSDKHYFRRREIIEAAALVRTVLVPVDHLALLTFLRSATVGVPDAALLPLWQRRFPDLVTRLAAPGTAVLDELRALVAQAAAHLPSDIPGLEEIRGWEHSLTAALENLAHLRHSFSTEPADRFIDQLRQRFLFDITESARHLGIYRLANLDRFFRELERALEEQDGDVQSVLRALRRSVADSEEATQALPEGATEAAVQIMTIHGAKGLEFGHVYLPQLHSKGRQYQIPSVQADRRWLPGRQAQYILFGSPTPGFDQVELRESEIARTEQIRTLYVALTRAINRLVLLGNWPQDLAPLPEQRRVTYLDLVRSRPRLPESLADLAERCRVAKKPSVDHGGIRWRFPGLESHKAKGAGKRSAKTGLPTIKSVDQQSARLANLQKTAAERMGRRIAGAASDEAGQRLARLLGDEAPPQDQVFAREIALPVGSAFHRMMETWRMSDNADSELARQRQIQNRWLESTLASDQTGPAQDRFEALLKRFRRGQFSERFAALEGTDMAREVPIIVAPPDSESGPVGFVTGFIDLLYRDPDTGGWVIVDYKTDHLENDSEIEERAQDYLLQEAVYARALQQSLHLEQPPATQLWFIWPDVLWEDSNNP